jgi:hypothetical protein
MALSISSEKEFNLCSPNSHKIVTKKSMRALYIYVILSKQYVVSTQIFRKDQTDLLYTPYSSDKFSSLWA